MTELSPKCAPMAIGSFPYKDPAVTLDSILRYFPETPLWPQLPMAHFSEQMYVQYHQGMPGITLDGDAKKLVAGPVDDAFFEDMAETMELIMNEDTDAFAITSDRAAGLYHFMENGPRIKSLNPLFIKGQVTGPVSFALTVTDRELKPILYDESYREAVTEVLKMKALWQLNELKKIHENVAIFVDEPYLASVGSSMVALSAEEAGGMIERITGAILEKGGIPGIHCCGNTDWTYLLNSSCRILSFDAYEYGETLLLYPDHVAAFLDKGGVLAWGIVPTSDTVLNETADSLAERLKKLIKGFVKKGLSEKTLLNQALITPSCGLGNLSAELAETIMKTTVQVSSAMKIELRVS